MTNTLNINVAIIINLFSLSESKKKVTLLNLHKNDVKLETSIAFQLKIPKKMNHNENQMLR